MTVVFFTDRDLGHQFPEILRASGLAVERHSDHFPPDAPDEHWMGQIARRGWVGITHDARIRYKPNELAAVVRHKARLIVVVGKTPYAELARSFVRTRSLIEEFIDRNEAPFIAKVYRASPADLAVDAGAMGRIERWYPR